MAEEITYSSRFKRVEFKTENKVFCGSASGAALPRVATLGRGGHHGQR